MIAKVVGGRDFSIRRPPNVPMPRERAQGVPITRVTEMEVVELWKTAAERKPEFRWRVDSN